MNNNALIKIYQLLTSRKFLSSFATVAFLLLGVEISEQLQAALIVAVTGVFSVSVGIQQGLDAFNNMEVPVGEKIRRLFLSRKFYLLIASAAYILFGVELDPEWVAAMIAVITGVYNFGTSIETGLLSRA